MNRLEDQKNLWAETVYAVQAQGHFFSDILFATDGERWCDAAEFQKLSMFVEYDSGFGGEFINHNLMVVGDGWWLERHEYDGSEWWEYKTLPAKPRKQGPVKVEDRS